MNTYRVFAAVIDGKVVSVPFDIDNEVIYQLSIFPTREDADKTGYDPSVIKEVTIVID